MSGRPTLDTGKACIAAGGRAHDEQARPQCRCLVGTERVINVVEHGTQREQGRARSPLLRSGLIARLSRYLDLTTGERDVLDWAERRELRLRAGEMLVAEGGDNDLLYVVQRGWLHSSVRLANDRRQILSFSYAGDLMGTSSIAWAQAPTTMTAVSDCIVSELPKVNLGRIFQQEPRLAALLYAVAAADNVAMSSRLTSIGRMDARERLAMLLLDMLARLRVTEAGIVDAFDLPLTQTDIGDALGLTKVHVNRTFRALEESGLVERTGRRIRLLDEARLVAMTGFVSRYHEIETKWLPSPTSTDR